MIITLIALLLFGIIVIKDSNPKPFNDSFLDRSFSNGLKGIASVLIMLAHIPENYGNFLTEIILCLGFTYVSIFFMISAYGCKFLFVNNKKSKNSFISKRFVSLFLPAVIINTLEMIFNALVGNGWDVRILINFNRYIYVIGIIYIAFWFVWYKLKLSEKKCDTIMVFFIIIISVISMYTPYKITGYWAVDSYGVIWGILLFNYRDIIYKKLCNKRYLHIIFFGTLSLILGVLYIKYKYVIFLGDYILKATLGISILVLYLLVSCKCTFKGKCIQWLGNISYEIYLTHIAVINFLKSAFPNLQGELFILLTLVLSLVLSTIVHQVILYINTTLAKS